MNVVIQQLCKTLHISHKPHSSFSPQSNGRIESVNRQIKSRVLKISATTGLPWPQCVPLARLIVNLTPNHTGLSPHEILYGRPYVVPCLTPFVPPPIDHVFPDSQNYLAYEMKKYLSSKPIVSSIRPEEAAGGAPDDQPQPLPHSISPGDYVVIKAKATTKGGRQRWGLPLYQGPYQVTLVHHHVLKVFGRSGWIPIRHVKTSPPPFKEDTVNVNSS